MTHEKEIPVLLLTGYLGSGKTTLLNRILANEKGIRFAVIVNDIGEVNIDADLIQKGGVVGQSGADDLVALQNGCICCTLKMDLVEQLHDIASTGRFDYIVIEASGICEPEPIAQTIESIPQLDSRYSRGEAMPRLDCIATVVDALRMSDEFGSGKHLQRKDIAEDDIENLVIQQIEFCNVIILNKISEISREQADDIRSVIRALQPAAKIIECDYADFDFEEILGTGSFDFESVATSATWVQKVEGAVEEDEHEHHHEHHHHDHEHEHDHHHHHDEEGEAEEYGIQTFVYNRRPAMDITKFDRFVASAWPRNVIRAKGMVYFNSDTDMCYLFEQAGSQKKLTEAGQWYATAPAADLERFMAANPGLRRDWDPHYGDRMQKIVFIGRNLDREAITAALDACLVK